MKKQKQTYSQSLGALLLIFSIAFSSLFSFHLGYAANVPTHKKSEQEKSKNEQQKKSFIKEASSVPAPHVFVPALATEAIFLPSYSFYLPLKSSSFLRSRPVSPHNLSYYRHLFRFLISPNAP